MKIKLLLLVYFFLMLLFSNSSLLIAQDTVRYIGTTLSNVDYHHGQLSPAIGVHNIQTFRASRADTGVSNWTYNHGPMLAYWNNTFYLEYLSNPIGEHLPPGRTLLQTSKDGYTWSTPVVIFPPYKIPDGFKKKGGTEVANNAYAVMHQRIGFYTSRSKRLFALAYYGIVLGKGDSPNDGNGIGRVIREIKTDGTYGPLYFLRYNHSFNENNTSYPFYKTSGDKGFITACEELLNTPLLMLQMAEEADRNDSLIPLKMVGKAFNYYHLPNGNVVGLWKWAGTSISKDEGRTWQYNLVYAPGFVNGSAKIWGQKTSDGKYSTIYNPSEFRWPLALSVSDDGLNYKSLLLVNGEITSMRYGGAGKNYGPQYVRGIQEMDGKPMDGNIWVTYSMNKEDIWISRIPIPVTEKETKHIDEDFSDPSTISNWNIFSPLWCLVQVQNNALVLHDSDPFDYAKAERVFPCSQKFSLEFSITPQQNNFGALEIELANAKGTPNIRLILDSSGKILAKQGFEYRSLGKYNAGEKLILRIELNTAARAYTVSINGGEPNRYLRFAPVDSVERITFRTGATRRFPDADTPGEQDYDVKNADAKDREAVFHIHHLKTALIKN